MHKQLEELGKQLEELGNHPLLKDTLELFNELMAKHGHDPMAKRSGGDDDSFPKAFRKASREDPRFSYNWNVQSRTGALLDLLQRLAQTPCYLAVFPAYKSFRAIGIDLRSWVRYHYAHWITSVYTVFDASLLLVNDAVFLGLRPQDCNPNTILKNRRVAADVRDVLKNILTLTSKHRNRRNLYLHRNELEMPEEMEELNMHLSHLWALETIDALGMDPAESGPLADSSDPAVSYFASRQGVMYMAKRKRTELISAIKKETLDIIAAVGSLINCLYPIYKLRIRVPVFLF